MKFLTINVGLLDYTLFGLTLFSNPSYSDQRVRVIPSEIRKIDADIVAIQECYHEHHVRFLFHSLQYMYPYMARKDGRSKFDFLRLHNGLLVFSKHEITRTELLSHEKKDRFEWWFADKSTLIVHIGSISIFNVHLTAGGINPESDQANLNRESSLFQILHIAEKYKDTGSTPVLMGKWAVFIVFLSRVFIVSFVGR